MLAEHLANALVSDKIILNEDKDIIQFGIESMGWNLIGMVLTFVVGICFKHVGEALLLCLWLFPLRKNAGGFHATSKTRCMIMSAVMLVVCFALFISYKHMMIFYGINVFVAGGIIWALAPIDNPLKELDVVERKVYRLRTRIILGAEGIVFALASIFRCKSIVRSITMSFFIVSTSLLLGILKFAKSQKSIKGI